MYIALSFGRNSDIFTLEITNEGQNELANATLRISRFIDSEDVVDPKDLSTPTLIQVGTVGLQGVLVPGGFQPVLDLKSGIAHYVFDLTAQNGSFREDLYLRKKAADSGWEIRYLMQRVPRSVRIYGKTRYQQAVEELRPTCEQEEWSG